MPIYEYEPVSGECTQCNGRFSDLQKMSDKPHTSCPTCGQACQKIISLFSVTGSAAGKRQPTQIAPSTTKAEEKKSGHNHNCAAAGCFKRADALLKKSESR